MAAAPGSSRPTALRVLTIIVTYNSRLDISACLRSISAVDATLDIVVVDNASSDRTAEHVARDHPDVQLYRNATNRGFSAAVNQAVAWAVVDPVPTHLLLVNPDATLEPGALDALVELAVRRPTGGVYGGRMTSPAGELDATSCLAAPSLWHALAFGLGLSALHGRPFVDPDSLRGWRRTGEREVPVLTGALLLIARPLWARLDGLDERYFLYGEDIDFCLRAARLGYRPLFTDAARYAHRVGSSSAPAARKICVLRSRATLYAAHVPPPGRGAAQRALRLGVGLRALAEWILRRDSVWRQAWRHRRDWTGGWPAS